ncbi:cyclic nucleotide-binding domain-containing protein [Synechocystis sp. LKSZ1]|uniref:cyclic nucleotide-binding domain-containing protein n=1 Tax=Synechocystis sp. LKSZ1 TaxID=3144951 RepID=UPI00336C09D9
MITVASAAFFQGILGASSMALGALLAMVWKPGRQVSAAIMAFGSGTLIAALAFEIASKVYQKSNFWVLMAGFLVGGLLFTNLSRYIDEKGGFLRKPAASRRYVVEHYQTRPLSLMECLDSSEVLQTLPEAEKSQLAQLLTPHYAKPGDCLCQEGDPGDYFYFIAVGIADVYKGQTWISRLGAGEIFGEMSLLTNEPRSATVIAATPMELYRLDPQNFSQVLTQSPHLALAISRTLARRLRRTEEVKHEQKPESLIEQVPLWEPLGLSNHWQQENSTLEKLTQHSAPMAILVGTLLDNIPEAMVIGMNANLHSFGSAFLFAVFISNFPEALSSAFGMKQAGISSHRILYLWLGVVFSSGLIAIAGHWLQGSLSDTTVSLTEAVAGGGMLAMLASTMMPEAYELGGSSVSYATIIGFLMGFWISTGGLG